MPPKAKTENENKAPEQNNAPAETPQYGVVTVAGQPSWIIEKLNKRSGELKLVPKYKYLEGTPKEIRFDAKNGGFSVGGLTKLPDTLRMKPIAWRFFQDDILTMGLKEWLEIFFIDADNNVCAVLFHQHSVKNFKEAMTALYYNDVELNEVVVVVGFSIHTAEKVVGKPSYALAEFTFEMDRPDEEIVEMADFAKAQRIYRRQTLTQNAVHELTFNYYNPFDIEPEADQEV